VQLEFVYKRVRFRFHIRLYLLVWESPRFKVHMDYYYMFYYIHEKYGNSTSMDVSHFKRLLHKIEGINFFIWFLWINMVIYRLRRQTWHKFLYVENQNCALNAAWMSSGTKIVVDEYNCQNLYSRFDLDFISVTTLELIPNRSIPISLSQLWCLNQ
jgi:hypothetical protein